MPKAVGFGVGFDRLNQLHRDLLRGYEEGVLLLRRDEKRGVMMALPVTRGRPRRGEPLMTTPLAELDIAADRGWNRSLCAWGAWLAQVSK